MGSRSWMVALAITMFFATAHADPKQDAKPHVLAGDHQYQVGRFDAALAEYSEAYELYSTPPLLFNIAQCHRGMKNWERAIFFFDGYLAARPQATNRKIVEDLIAEAQAELDRVRDAEAAARRRASADEELRQHTVQLRIDEDQRSRTDAERQKLEDSRRLVVARRAEPERLTGKWWFWTAVGSAALIAGGTAYYFSGSTTMVPPTGSLGGLDRR